MLRHYAPQHLSCVCRRNLMLTLIFRFFCCSPGSFIFNQNHKFISFHPNFSVVANTERMHKLNVYWDETPSHKVTLLLLSFDGASFKLSMSLACCLRYDPVNNTFETEKEKKWMNNVNVNWKQTKDTHWEGRQAILLKRRREFGITDNWNFEHRIRWKSTAPEAVTRVTHDLSSIICTVSIRRIIKNGEFEFEFAETRP